MSELALAFPFENRFEIFLQIITKLSKWDDDEMKARKSKKLRSVEALHPDLSRERADSFVDTVR